MIFNSLLSGLKKKEYWIVFKIKEKMNCNIVYGAFLLVILASCINSSLSDGSIDYENNNSPENGPTLMQILQNILENPEYQALSDYEQLSVLEVIYSLLESSFSQRKSASKYQGKNPFVNLDWYKYESIFLDYRNNSNI